MEFSGTHHRRAHRCAVDHAQEASGREDENGPFGLADPFEGDIRSSYVTGRA